MFNKVFSKGKRKPKLEDFSSEKMLDEWVNAQQAESGRQLALNVNKELGRYEKMVPQLKDETTREEGLDKLAKELRKACLDQEKVYISSHNTPMAKLVHEHMERLPEEERASARHRYQYDRPEVHEQRLHRQQQLRDKNTDPLTREQLEWDIVQEWLHQTGTSIPFAKKSAMELAFAPEGLHGDIEKRLEDQHREKVEVMELSSTEGQKIDRYHKNRMDRRMGRERQRLERD